MHRITTPTLIFKNGDEMEGSLMEQLNTPPPHPVLAAVMAILLCMGIDHLRHQWHQYQGRNNVLRDEEFIERTRARYYRGEP